MQINSASLSEKKLRAVGLNLYWLDTGMNREPPWAAILDYLDPECAAKHNFYSFHIILYLIKVIILWGKKEKKEVKKPRTLNPWPLDHQALAPAVLQQLPPKVYLI